MPQQPSVVVVGGANLDLLARSDARVVPATSNPGRVTRTPGGVGRNIAENLARLGTRVELVAAVGDDEAGEQVLGVTAGAGVGIGAVRRGPLPTGTYTAVVDDDGELVVAVADMRATDTLAPEDVDRAAGQLAAADLVVLDGNLAPACAARVLELATAAGVPVVVEPVSVPKARALAPLLDGRPVRTVTPNLAELDALLGVPPADGGPEALEDLVSRLHARGVEEVWVRLGARGSILSTPHGVTRHAVVPTEAGVVDVTGAGDAMLAAYCHARLAGADPARAAAYGQAAAALTVASTHTVRPDLTDALVRSLLR